MRNKIIMFALMCALMVGLFPLHHAEKAYAATETTADDVKYKDIEDFMHGMGYTSFQKKDGYFYIVSFNAEYNGNECFILHELNIFYDYQYFTREPYIALNSSDEFLYVLGVRPGSYHYYYYVPSVAGRFDNFDVVNYVYTEYHFNSTYATEFVYKPANVWLTGIEFEDFVKFEDIVYCDLPIYSIDGVVPKGTFPDLDYSNVVYEGNISLNYDFPLWCADAGLKPLASSNESPAKIPYSYNDYWHIVRKTSNGKWLLTTIGNSVMAENIPDYRLYIGDNGNLHVASIYGGENENGYKLNVRQYEYDTDGWKVRMYETLDTRDYSGIVDLGAGSGFDGVRMLAYTNVDIFVGAEYEPTYPKSTEYYEVTTNPPTEEPEEPSVTPGPSGGGVGGGNDVVVPEFDIDWDNVKLADIPQIIEQVKDAILGFFDIVGVVPLMIGAVFGFLPTWCLWMFGLSFALLGVLLVIKLIRG